jgi:hypothetical protein
MKAAAIIPDAVEVKRLQKVYLAGTYKISATDHLDLYLKT